MLNIRVHSGDVVSVPLAEAVDTVLQAPYVRWYDALPSGEPDRIDIMDLAFPAFLDAVPNFKALLSDCGAEELQQKLDAASAALKVLPHGSSLATFDDNDENRVVLKRLFQACTGGANSGFPQFGPARATKLLHKKRPDLLPIIDSWQLEAWDKRSDRWSTDDMVDVVFAIRDQIASNGAALSEVGVRARHADQSLPALSDLRIYDILFWEMSRPPAPLEIPRAEMPTANRGFVSDE